MNPKQAKKNLLSAIVDFKSICHSQGQSGLISTGISESLFQCLSDEQLRQVSIRLTIQLLSQKLE
jgi:hypothetical protein